jgi:hypothetical protein
MQSTPHLVIPARLHSVAALALLLEKLERHPRQASPEQYRIVARSLSSMLAQTPLDAPLNEVLRAFPAAAELYENQQYGRAGLCRHRLDAAAAAEQATNALLTRVRRPA